MSLTREQIKTMEGRSELYPPFHTCCSFQEHVKHLKWIKSGDLRHPGIKRDLSILRAKKKAVVGLKRVLKPLPSKPDYTQQQL